MEASSARTLTASLILITTAAFIARSFFAAATLSGGTTTKVQRVKRKSKSQRNQTDDEPRYVAGLVNVGNTCFMNAILQALASLPSLKEYLRDRHDIGHDTDSITQALYETVEMLNTVYKRPTSKQLVKMVKTIKVKAAHVLTSQQQDAQELFQILSTQLSEEREKVDNATTLSLIEILDPLSRIPSSASPAEKGARRQPSVSAVVASSLSSSTVLAMANRNNLHLQRPPHSITPGKIVEGEMREKAGDSGGEDYDQDVEISTLMTSSLMLDRTAQAKYKRAKSPFMGLLASRVSCIDCGYTAAIRHSTFDSLSLTVPLQYSCNLEQCLDSFIHLDTISDFNCRKCTLLGASADLSRKIEQGKKIQRQRENKEQEGQELQALEQSEYQMNSRILMTLTEETQHKLSDTKSPTTPDDPSLTQDAPAPAKRRRSSRLQSSLSEPFADNKTTSPKPGKISLAEMEQLKARVDLCLSSDIEMDLAPIELTPVRSKRTTKHSMIAKPPQALCLHLNRSMFTSSGQMAKNPCKVMFDSRLDFTRFTTSGHLTTVPTKTMSRRGSISETISSNKMASSTNGRIPLSTSASFSGSLSPSTVASWAQTANMAEQGGKEAEDGERVLYSLWSVVVHLGSHNSGHFVTYRRIPNSSDEQLTRDVSNDDKWWRISDEDVQIVEWALVKNVEAYMLFYEKLL